MIEENTADNTISPRENTNIPAIGLEHDISFNMNSVLNAIEGVSRKQDQLLNKVVTTEQAVNHKILNLSSKLDNENTKLEASVKATESNLHRTVENRIYNLSEKITERINKIESSLTVLEGNLLGFEKVINEKIASLERSSRTHRKLLMASIFLMVAILSVSLALFEE